MKRMILLAFFTFVVALSAAPAFAAKGAVVYRRSGCDYFVVQSPQGYALLEWYGGNDPDRGDVLVGKYDEYGMKEIYNETADEEVTVWVEEYWLSKEDVLEQLQEHCE